MIPLAAGFAGEGNGLSDEVLVQIHSVPSVHDGANSDAFDSVSPLANC